MAQKKRFGKRKWFSGKVLLAGFVADLSDTCVWASQQKSEVVWLQGVLCNHWGCPRELSTVVSVCPGLLSWAPGKQCCVELFYVSFLVSTFCGSCPIEQIICFSVQLTVDPWRVSITFLWILSCLDWTDNKLLSSTHSPPMESLDSFCPVSVRWGMCCCTSLIQSGRAISQWKHARHWETQTFGISWNLAGEITLIAVLARPEKVSNLVFYSQSTSKDKTGPDTPFTI